MSLSLSTWLALSFTPKIGIRSLKRIAGRTDIQGLSAIQIAQRLGFTPEQQHFLSRQAPPMVEACLFWQQQQAQRHILCFTDPHYPALLSHIASAPPILFVEGDLACLQQPQIAMVGSRNASRDGQQIAQQFAAQLVQEKLVITSGLALGIDGHAHHGALQAGGGTIAVLGSGLASIYPARHKALAQRIIEQGALVSEFPPNTKPRAEHFPRRNRIISGLSLGVIVIEAAEKSGSLITARYALEHNRDVFVVPGSILNPNSLGSNQLIREGACLVQQVQHVLDEIQPLLNWTLPQIIDSQIPLFSTVNSQEELPFPELLANLGDQATAVDILAEQTQRPVQEVMAQLLELELLGHVVAVSGGYLRRRGEL